MRILAALIAFAFIIAMTVPDAAAAQTSKKVAAIKNKVGPIKRK